MGKSGAICKKIKSSSSGSSEDNLLDSFDSYDLSDSINDIYFDWLNDILLSYHEYAESTAAKKYERGSNYIDDVINFLIYYDNLNPNHFMKVADYLDVEPILVYSRYLKLMKQKKMIK